MPRSPCEAQHGAHQLVQRLALSRTQRAGNVCLLPPRCLRYDYRQLSIFLGTHLPMTSAPSFELAVRPLVRLARLISGMDWSFVAAVDHEHRSNRDGHAPTSPIP